MTDERTGPLTDITIIDCTMALAGPFGTALLADLGANVIKIEPPHGDQFRPLPPFLHDYAHPAKRTGEGTDYGAAFASVNRNKRSVCLDLKNDDDKETFLQLCEKADGVVENMRAGVMDKLGLGYETIAARNPRIVYGAVRGFGDPRTGESPFAQWPCLDVAAQSLGGLVHANDKIVQPAVADVYPGTLMALGVLAAIHNARATGKGQFVDVAMYDSIVTLMRNNVAAYGFNGKVVPASERRSPLMPFGLFPAKDGQIAIAAPAPNHWERLCAAMTRPDLLTDERTQTNPVRVKNFDYAWGEISRWTASLTRREIMDALGGKVPVGSAQDMAEVFDDPHLASREMLDTYSPNGTDEVRIAASPMKFTETPGSFYQKPPRLGEHNEEVLAEFGIPSRP